MLDLKYFLNFLFLFLKKAVPGVRSMCARFFLILLFVF